MPARVAAAPALLLCGLGTAPRRTASLEALHALAGCDAVLLVDGDPAVSAVLGEFCPGVRRLRGGERAVLAELARGRCVGVASAGHPLSLRRVAALARRCALRGVDCRSFGAVTPADEALAGLGRTLSIDWAGLQLFSAAELASARIEPGAALVVSIPGEGLGAPATARLSRRLRRLPGARACYVLEPGAPARGPLPPEALSGRLAGGSVVVACEP